MRLGRPATRRSPFAVRFPMLAILAGLALVAAACDAPDPAATAQHAVRATPLPPAATGPRVDLKILLLDRGGAPEIGAWASTLARLQTPFDLVDVGARTLTPDMLAVGAGHARYAGVVVANPGTLTDEEWAVLTDYELTFGIRQVVAWTWGWGANGLAAPFGFDGWPSGWNGQQVVGALTAAGRDVFPYLAGTVPFDNQWGVLAAPDPAADFQTLVEGPEDPEHPGTRAALVGIHTYPDGRQEMVTTIEYSVWDLDQKALLQGQLAWVTKGVYLGHWRNYFSMHFDDVLGADGRWSTATHETLETLPPIRMVPSDVARAAEWSGRNGVRLDLVFNGKEATAAEERSGLRNGQRDALTRALVAAKASFGWISHTFSHEDLDAAGLQTLTSEIKKNVAWATSNGLPSDHAELVTGGHTGLANPFMAAALDKTGVRVIASDASHGDALGALGSSLVLPRHPCNLAYNVGTREEQLDEFNWIYRDDPWVKAPVSWKRYVDLTADGFLGFIMGNDPRPHFAHQNNLAEDGTFYDVADAILARYRAWFSVPLAQPTMTEAAALLAKARAWNDALQAGQVTVYFQGGAVRIEASVPVSVPLSGTSAGTVYGGLRSGWVDVAPGAPLAVPMPR
jgi:hypothetical protein